MAQLLPSANIYENKKQIIAKMGQSTKTVREEKKGVEGEEGKQQTCLTVFVMVILSYYKTQSKAARNF